MYGEISDIDLFVQTSLCGLGLYKKDLGPIQGVPKNPKTIEITYC
jgi:hypothetical protein